MQSIDDEFVTSLGSVLGEVHHVDHKGVVRQIKSLIDVLIEFPVFHFLVDLFAFH